MKKLLVILALVSVPSFAFDDIEDPCKVKGGGVMAGYQCVEQKMKSVDKKLNERYLEAVARISEEEAALRVIWSQAKLVEPFRKAQRAWLKTETLSASFPVYLPRLHLGKVFKLKNVS
ncbi:lysozyme inhibitor LprI family protein [Vibrio scophthalmi]|uniref:Lysozyme inhibitor LprI-like N-terminal domain-containing protein n=1 Tax=Vibrio scophthalmi TaxID=45658 RepID=A0A1E3WLD5_9VIBR|nr:hypothetical protein VSF3289_00849 [Vibrio scophthalmi]